MSRQSEILLVASVLDRFDIPNSAKVAASCVDYGIGSKDRFEIGESMPFGANLIREIKPKEYKA